MARLNVSGRVGKIIRGTARVVRKCEFSDEKIVVDTYVAV
jgi:hypothetical protein